MLTTEIDELPHIGTLTHSGVVHNEGKVQFLKRLQHEWASKKEIADRFIESCSRNRHIRNRKFIASMLKTRQDTSGVFLTREYVEGQSLEQWFQVKRPGIDPRVFVMQLCEALRQLHTRGIVHGGIHPRNIIIRPNGEIKLTDEGISKAVLTNTIKDPYPIAALRYLAPEQWRNESISMATDFYATALLIYQLVHGRELVRGETPLAIKQHVLGGLTTDVSALAKALHRNPQNRFANAEEMQHALHEWLESLPTEDTSDDHDVHGDDTTDEEPEQPGSFVELTDFKNQLNLMRCYGGQPWLLPRTGRDQQWPFMFRNGGPGELRVTFACRGQGATIAPQTTYHLKAGQRRYAILNLTANGSDWVRLDVTWQGQQPSQKLQIRLFRPNKSK